MAGSPSAEEAAAIATAVGRFVIETAPAQASHEEAVGEWQRAALAEGIGAKATVQEHLEGGSQWQW
jgi:hypothetical protein